MSPKSSFCLFALLALAASGGCAFDGPSSDAATGGSTTDGGAGTGGSATGGQPALGGSGGSASDSNQVGPCTFDDEALAQDVREQVPYGDEDNVLTMTSLSTGEDVSSLGGLECLAALTDLYLSGAQTTAVLDLTPILDLPSLSILGLRGGQYDHPEVIREIPLSHLQLSELGWTSLDVLEGADIAVLWIEHMPATDLSALSTFASLRSVRLEDTSTSDLSVLADVTALQDLYVNAVPVSELPALGELEHLQWLSLIGTPISTLEGLAGAPELGTLDIDSAPELETLSGLEGLPALYRLSIHDSAVSDLSALAGAPSLGHLDIIDSAVDDISALETCQSLQYVTLSGNQIVSVEPLAALTPQFLWLDRNEIVDLEPLPGVYLHTLNISENPVGSLEPLGALEQLSSLYMKGVGATSLDSLAGLELEDLDASDNQIEDVSVLASMPLRELDLSANDIVSLPDDFVGGTGDCSLTQLEENPLDAASTARLESLCAETEQDSYSWDDGSCNNCFILD